MEYADHRTSRRERITHKLQYTGTVQRVQRSGWFIQKQHGAWRAKASRDVDALLLAA